MKLCFLLLISLVCALAAGCHKKSEPPANVESSVATKASGAQPTMTDGNVAPPEPPQPPSREVLARAENNARQTVVGDVDAFLTGQLQAFIAEKNRLPADFGEFARARLDSVPRPPAGKKWVIDTESLEVKAVAAQ